MDLSFSEEQAMLRDMVNRLCHELMPLTTLRELEGTEPGYSADFWQQLGELGLTGLNIPESYGGLQLGALESVVVAEEFGRCLAVSPFQNSSVVSAALIELAGDNTQKSNWLPQVASGEKIISIASDEYGAGFDKNSISVSASPGEGGYILNGTKYYVPFAASADTLIVLAKLESDKSPEQGQHSIVGLCIDKSILNSSGVALSYLPNHAKDPLYKVTFESVEVPAENVLNQGQCIWQDWEQAMSAGLIPLAAYAVGASQQVQAITVEYAKYRHAFGRPIGGFQAISHYLADVEVLIEGAQTLVYQAAWARDNGKPFALLAAMAKLQACDVFCRAAAVAIQVHGGIGYTLEADPQLFFRRAKQLQQLYWGPDFLEQRIAQGVFV